MKIKFQKISILTIILSLLTIVFIYSVDFVTYAASRLTYKNGKYTNIAGSGLAATFYSSPADCKPSNGNCTTKSGEYIYKFSCKGKHNECRNNESIPLTGKVQLENKYKLASSNKERSLSCDETVQIDVFDKVCRDSKGAWVCGDSNLKGYMVWYNPKCDTPEQKVPICKLTVKTSGQFVPVKADFDASGSFDPDGKIVSYSYRINNESNTITTDNPKFSRTFTNPGNYRVTLSVKDNSNLTSSQCVVNVEAKTPVNNPPVCKIASAHPTTGKEPLEVRFDGSSSHDKDGKISKYFWDFGDGSKGEGRIVMHTYKGKDKNYLARLTVQDDKGKMSSNLCEVPVRLTKENVVNKSFQIEKKVRKAGSNDSFKDKLYLENVTVSKSIEVEFQVKVKNTGDYDADEMEYKDDLPEHFTRSGGHGLTENWDDFDSGEEVKFIIKAKLSGDTIKPNMSDCYINTVDLTHKDDFEGSSAATVCVSTGTVTELPSTGPTSNLIMTVLGLSSLTTGMGLKFRWKE